MSITIIYNLNILVEITYKTKKKKNLLLPEGARKEHLYILKIQLEKFHISHLLLKLSRNIQMIMYVCEKNLGKFLENFGWKLEKFFVDEKMKKWKIQNGIVQAI